MAHVSQAEAPQRGAVTSMKVEYYIKSPNGRQKITPAPVSDAEAIRAFKDHWTATVTWAVNGKRVLVKEVKEEILVEDVFKS